MRPSAPANGLWPALLRAMVAVLAMTVSVGCSSDGGGFVSTDGDLSPEQQQEIETFIGTELPDSVLAVETRAELIRGGIDDAVRLRLAVPPADVQPFLDRVGFDDPLRQGYRGVRPADGGTDWFRTADLTEFEGTDTVGDKALQVTVDVSDPALAVVYLQVFEL